MHRYTPRLVRGAATAGISIFLVAGAAFAASAIMTPRDAAPDLVPAAATGARLDATTAAEATGTAEPTETPAAAGAAEPTETPEANETAKLSRKAQPAATPEVEDQTGEQASQGDDNSHGEGAQAAPTAPATPALGESDGGQRHGDGGSGDSPGSSD